MVKVYESTGKSVFFEFGSRARYSNFIHAKQYCISDYLSTGNFDQQSFNGDLIRDATPDEEKAYFELKANSPYNKDNVSKAARKTILTKVAKWWPENPDR